MVKIDKSGVCEVCGGTYYADMYQHRKTKGHIRKEQEQNESQADPHKQEDSEIIKVNGEGASSSDAGKPDSTDDSKQNSKHDEVKPDPALSTIQIIDGSTAKPAKNAVESLLEIAFSEQFAPITMSLLTGLAERLNNKQNPQQEQGSVVTGVNGAKIQLLNKNF